MNNQTQDGRWLAGWLVICLLFWAIVGCLLTGCGSRPVINPVNVEPARAKVEVATTLGKAARKAVADARTEAASDAPDMAWLITRLDEADTLLDQQQTALETAQADLETAAKAAALTAQELERVKAESRKWQIKYERLKKYRVMIIVCMVAVGGFALARLATLLGIRL